MKIYLTTSAGTTEITNLITDVTLSGDYQTAARLLKFGVVSNHNDKNIPAVKCNLGSGIIMTENGENIFNGFIYGREKTTGDSIIDVSCYDKKKSGGLQNNRYTGAGGKTDMPRLRTSTGKYSPNGSDDKQKVHRHKFTGYNTDTLYHGFRKDRQKIRNTV